MGWRALRIVTIVIGGVITMRLLTQIPGPHCSASLYPSLSFGAPIGVSLSTAVLSYARHGRWLRTVAMALLVLLGSFVCCSVAADSLFGAIDRGKQTYTMARMRELAAAIEEGRQVGKPVDGWGTPFLIEQSGTSITIVSFGDCGEPDIPNGAKYQEGTTYRSRDDIVFSDGRFIRYPQGTQR